MFLDASDAALISGGLVVLTEREKRNLAKLKVEQEAHIVCKPKSWGKGRKGTWRVIRDQVLANVKPSSEEIAKYEQIILDIKREFGYPESHWKK